MTDVAPDLTQYFEENDQEYITSDAAWGAASARRLFYAGEAAKGGNYYSKLMEEDFPIIYKELVNNPNAKNKLSAWSEGRLADALVGLYYSSNDDGSNNEEGQVLAQNLYDLLGDRLDNHLSVYNDTIVGELKAGDHREQQGFWKKVLGGVINVADYLDIAWEQLGAPVLGNTFGLVSRGHARFWLGI